MVMMKGAGGGSEREIRHAAWAEVIPRLLRVLNIAAILGRRGGPHDGRVVFMLQARRSSRADICGMIKCDIFFRLVPSSLSHLSL